MSIRVHVNGQIRSEQDAQVSVFDRGFLYGDSVFETLRTENGVLFALTDHLERLEASASLIGMKSPPRETVAAAVHETLVAANNRESKVRIIVSRGVGWGDLDPHVHQAPRLVVMVAERGGPTPEMYARGVAVRVVSVLHNHPRALDPRVKSGNYLNVVLAVAEARRAGAHEAILCTEEGNVAEGATSNVFAVIDGRLETPALEVGIFPGITRRHVIAVCQREGIAVTESSSLPLDRFRAAQEVFLTSSLRGVLPVTEIDGQPVGLVHHGAPAPGPLTRQIRMLYETWVAATAERTPS
ncbi:MAG TPA: aminotransferase class IV [Polyangia bacterium]